MEECYYYKLADGPIKPFAMSRLDEKGDTDPVLKSYILYEENVEEEGHMGYELWVPCNHSCKEHSHISVGGQNYLKGVGKSLFAVVRLICDSEMYFTL